MDLNFRLLILHTDRVEGAALAARVMPLFPFIGFDIAISEQTGLDAHLQNCYDVCLVCNGFPESRMSILIRDINKLYAQRQQRACKFIRVVASIEDDSILQPFLDAGYSGVISESLSSADQSRFTTSVGDLEKEVAAHEQLKELDAGMRLVLAEIDRVSQDRKRGKTTKFNATAINFVDNLVEFDASIMDKYFDALATKTEIAATPKFSKVKIPGSVLKRELPNLFESGYSGASSRVWLKLLNRFGVSEDLLNKQATTTDTAETTVSEIADQDNTPTEPPSPGVSEDENALIDEPTEEL